MGIVSKAAKTGILKMIQAQYPDADSIEINLIEKSILARCYRDPTLTIKKPVDINEQQQIDFLSDFFEVPNLREIRVVFQTKEVKFIGDETKVI